MTSGVHEHEAAAAAAAACAGVDALLDVDLAALDDAALHQVLTSVLRVQARLGVVSADALSRWDARGAWRNNGSRSPAHRFARETRSAVDTGRAAIRRARALPFMTHTRQAVLDGRLSWDHVDLFAQACTPARRDVFAEHEQLLVSQCVGVPFGDAITLIRYWQIQADEKLAADKREREGTDGDGSDGTGELPSSKLHASRTLHDRVVVQGELDAIDGAIVVGELDRLAEAIRLADLKADVRRTPAQRRAAAFVEMAKRSATAPVGGRRPQPLFTVLVGDTTFQHLCELADGTVVRTKELVPHLDSSIVESVIFDGPITIVGVSHRRTFVGAVRRAIQVRDRRCRHPSECDVPASKCDVDHIVPWANHGETSQFNGRLECWPHNRFDDLHDHGAAPYPSRPVCTRDITRVRAGWKLGCVGHDQLRDPAMREHLVELLSAG